MGDWISARLPASYSLWNQMFSVFRSFWELNVRRMEPAWPVTADMAEYRLPSETERQRKEEMGGLMVGRGEEGRRFRDRREDGTKPKETETLRENAGRRQERIKKQGGSKEDVKAEQL